MTFSALHFSQAQQEYNVLLKKAERFSYNFEFDSCTTYLEQAIMLKPERPEAYQLKSKIFLWYYLGSQEESDYKKFVNYSDSAIIKIDKILSSSPENIDLIYLLGNIYKNRAMAYGTSGSTLDAFWATKNAVSYFEDVIDLDSNYYSAYGGIGIFEYALSYVPALFNWALVLSGLTADQHNGFDLVKLASEKGKQDIYEFKFHLSKLYDEHLADYSTSLNILKKLLNRFPKNSLFHYQAAVEYIKLHQLKLAEAELNKVLDVSNPKFHQTNSFSKFLLGDVYFRQNNYKLALEYYLEFLTTTKIIDYTGMASLRAAYCYYFLGNETEFRKYLLLAANGNLDLEDDKFAKETGLKFLGNGFSSEDEILILSENSYLSDNTNFLMNIETDSLNNHKVLSQILIFQSNVLIGEGKLDSAEKTLEIIDSLDLANSEWVEPYKYFNLARISFEKGNYSLANQLLQTSEDNNDYLKKSEIQSLINGLRNKLMLKKGHK